MRSTTPRPILLALAALLLLTLPAFAAPPGGEALSRVGRWMDRDGQLLPFNTEAEVLEFLRTAAVVSSEEITGTSSRPRKMVLEKDGVKARAIFRTVRVERDKMANVAEHARGFRDDFVFEVAAFELSRVLGLDNVPPAVLRTLERQDGSMQLWVEHAAGVAERIEKGIREQHAQLWQYQKQNMVVFDILIYNFDRNPSNMLIDSLGKLWFVDHTRAFKVLPALKGREKMQVLERRFWDKLRTVKAATIRAALDPYLRTTEVDALLTRRKKLVKHIEKRIQQHGEQAILFEFVAGSG